MKVVAEETASLNGVREASGDPSVSAAYRSAIQDFNRLRGRDLYFPFLGSGAGSGPFVELADGSVKYDMITGIGVNLFGHAHPAFVSEVIDSSVSDVQQGNIQPGLEAAALVTALLKRVGKDCRLSHAWLTTCGTMANETALKIIRQKKFPATRVIAFEDGFSGRSTAMQEITDNAKYREGQPTYGEVTYVPHFDRAAGLKESVERVVRVIESCTTRYPGKYAAITLELVQGEGGFVFGPKEFYEQIFEAAKRAGLAIWVDEIQTFGRTGELFAYQTLGLEKWVDVVTVAKTFQASATMFAAEFNPRPGLVAGTFSGSTTALRTGRRTLELFDEERMFGADGKVRKLSARFEANLERLKQGPCKGKIGELRIIGGMVGFVPLSGTMEDVKRVLFRLFDLGVVAFYCGHGPYLVRMLPPLGCMVEKDVDAVCTMIEGAVNTA